MISVIIPAYNASPFVQRTVDSIKEQTFSDWELILVNDGSNDETGSIIDEIAEGDNRIRAFHQENGGEVSARRIGVLNAHGEWIMFVDADDILPPDAMKSLLSLETDADIIAGTMHVKNIADDGTILEDYIWKNRRIGSLNNTEFAQGVLLGEVQMAVWSKLYKRTLFDGFDWCLDRTIKQNPDLLMNIGIGARAKSVYVTNDAVCYDYIIHSGSASTSEIMPYTGWYRLFDQVEKYLEHYDDTRYLRSSFRHYQMSCLNGLLRHGQIGFPKNDKHIANVLMESKQLTLNFEEKKVIALLKSRVLRVIFNWWQVRKHK